MRLRAGARGAAGRVALHDGDDAADDAPAALSFLKDDALYGLPQPLVRVLLWCSLVQLSDHNEAMIAQMFGLSREKVGQFSVRQSVSDLRQVQGEWRTDMDGQEGEDRSV